MFLKQQTTSWKLSLKKNQKCPLIKIIYSEMEYAPYFDRKDKNLFNRKDMKTF